MKLSECDMSRDRLPPVKDSSDHCVAQKPPAEKWENNYLEKIKIRLVALSRFGNSLFIRNHRPCHCVNY